MLAHIAVFLMLWPIASAMAQTSTHQTSDFFPLAVGNTWTYDHSYVDSRKDDSGNLIASYNYPDHESARGQFVLSILRTEVIDSNTYYVFSDMPSGSWPPPPLHFIAGKKLRWDGDNLMQHDGTSEYSIYRFDNPPTEDLTKTTYSLPPNQGV